jgi:hypothetical protein
MCEGVKENIPLFFLFKLFFWKRKSYLSFFTYLRLAGKKRIDRSRSYQALVSLSVFVSYIWPPCLCHCAMGVRSFYLPLPPSSVWHFEADETVEMMPCHLCCVCVRARGASSSVWIQPNQKLTIYPTPSTQMAVTSIRECVTDWVWPTACGLCGCLFPGSVLLLVRSILPPSLFIYYYGCSCHKFILIYRKYV